MATVPGRKSFLLNISVHEDSQPDVMPILDRLRKSKPGISKTICRLLVEFRDNGFKFNGES